jgi:hypothetical protein
MDAFLDCYDLCPDNRILASEDAEAEPRGRWNAIIVLVSDDLEQLCRAIAAFAEIMPSSAMCPRMAFDSIGDGQVDVVLRGDAYEDHWLEVVSVGHGVPRRPGGSEPLAPGGSHFLILDRE